MLHAKDVINPPVYLPSKLHADLQPNFQISSLNSGTYKLISDSTAKISLTIMIFQSLFLLKMQVLIKSVGKFLKIIFSANFSV